MSKRGAPDKVTRQSNKQARTKAKLVDEILKGEELLVDNYYEAIETIVAAAKGELKGVSVTNVISCAKTVIAMADEILEKQNSENGDVGGSDTPEENTPQETTSLISLVPLKKTAGE